MNYTFTWNFKLTNINFLGKKIMSGNKIGKMFNVTTFGSSHGTALGAIVDGCPAGLESFS